MRFTSLHMRPFGTFTDFELTFGKKTGLHLVYGTNGAGKSTTLEALRSVLYGIAPRKKVYAASDLRIGARIERENGESLEYLRRTSPKTPLWNKADDEPIAKEALTPFLGNLERIRFENLFGLDYKTMVEGGSDLLEGKGEVGRALFGAMLGGQRLRHVTSRLDGDLRSLYVDRSPKGRINELVKTHKSLTADLKKAALRPASYSDDRKKLKAAQVEGEEKSKAREEARALADELMALRRSAAALQQLETRRAERASLGDLTPLDEVKARRVVDFAKDAEALGIRADERAKAIHGLRESVARLTALASPDVLASSGAIEALSERRGAYREATEARIKLEEELRDARAKRAEAQRLAGADPAASEAPANIDELSEGAEQLSTKLARQEEACSLARETVCRLEPKTLAAAERVAGIEAYASAKLASDLLALAPFRGSLKDLAGLSVPAESELERRAVEEREDAAASLALRQERQRSEAEAQQAKDALQRLAAAGEGPPPTIAEVQAARQERDELIRTAFETTPKEPCTALDVARAVHLADELGDRRARESVRAAEREAQEGALTRATARAQELAAEEAAASDAAAGRAQAWAERLGDAGLEGGLARMDAASLGAWNVQRTGVLREAQGIRDEASILLERAKAEEDEGRARAKAAEGELALIRTEWEEWALARSLDPDAGPKSAQRKLRLLTGLQAADRDIARLEAETAQRSQSIVTFEKEVEALCEALGVSPATTEGVMLAEARMDSLQTALRQASQAGSELEKEVKRLAAEESQEKVATQRSSELEASLSQLAEHAGCSTRDDLLRLAELSDKARTVDADIRRIERELRVEHGEDVQEADLLAAIGDRTVQDLTSAWNDAQAAAKELDTAIHERAREEGSLRSKVESDGSAEAARIQSRLAEVETELAEATQEFLKVHLADELLKREIERNRQETHGPLLKRAQELFKVLTLGAYEQLHPSETASGKEVMVARRPNGRQVGVEEMSSGTCDQLYLALRIATVEHMLKTVEPMPFIADDLFVNFDDERTEAALRVLAELSKTTQVIVFSHHGSVVDTALRLTEEGVTVDVLRLEGEHARESARELDDTLPAVPPKSKGSSALKRGDSTQGNSVQGNSVQGGSVPGDSAQGAAAMKDSATSDLPATAPAANEHGSPNPAEGDSPTAAAPKS